MVRTRQGKKITLEHEDNNHGDVARFLLPFQQDVEEEQYTYRVDDLISRSSQRRKDKTLEEGVPHASVNVALLNPTTYMNRSGVSVKTFMNSHKWRLKKNAMALNRQDELLVLTDDVSLPFGTCRFKAKGGPGGQNGIKDIMKCVGTERFARLKIGIGAPEWFVAGKTGAPSGTAMDKYVLARFNADEQDELPVLLEYVNELLRLYLHRGLAQASTIANGMDLVTYKKQFRAKAKRV
jgi:peptidyl-tRNA hydrolase, PTH1 family